MRLSKFSLVEFEDKGDSFIYTYALLGLKIFKTKFFKMVLVSSQAHYWWKDVVENLRRTGLYFEDLKEGQPIDIGIGTLHFFDFNKTDKKNMEMSLIGQLILRLLLTHKHEQKTG